MEPPKEIWVYWGARATATNEDGEVIAMATLRLSDGTNNLVEEQATFLAIKLGLKLGFKYNIHIEGDSKIIVDDLKNK